MVSFDYDIGILGGGAAGLTVASGAASLGAKTLLVEKEPLLGGDCLHFGCVPSKTLIKTARVYALMKNAPAFGLPKVDVPPVDFKMVAGRIAQVIAAIGEHDSDERFCGLGARVVHGTPRFSDEHCVEIDGLRVSAKNWVIATGSSPGVPPIPGLAQSPYLTNKTIFSLGHLPQSLVVLGGGPIGVEMAQAFCRLGSRVDVVEMQEQILGPEDADMAGVVMEALRQEGVAFHLGFKCSGVHDLGDFQEVTIEKEGNPKTVLKAEAVLVALGRVPNTAGLGLENIGVKTSRQGVEVDSRLRTSHKHIFAAGDVNGGYQFTHVAGYEGGVVLANAILHLPRKVDYKNICWCTYTDPELASVGMNEKMAAKAKIACKVISEDFRTNDRALAEGEKTGKIKLVLSQDEKPLGIQICGLHAGELICEWVAVQNGKVGLSRLAGAIHPYPVLAEISKRAAQDVFAPKLYSETVKKSLKLFFRLKGRAC